MIITLEMLAPTGSRSCIPSFVKLAKRNDKETLKAGTYGYYSLDELPDLQTDSRTPKLDANSRPLDRFPVHLYEGRKAIFISTTTETW
jgi:hypothetical protein